MADFKVQFLKTEYFKIIFNLILVYSVHPVVVTAICLNG